MRTDTPARPLTVSLTHTTRARALTHSLTHAIERTYTCKHARSRKHTHTHARTHARTCARTHTYKHTHKRKHIIRPYSVAYFVPRRGGLNAPPACHSPGPGRGAGPPAESRHELSTVPVWARVHCPRFRHSLRPGGRRFARSARLRRARRCAIFRIDPAEPGGLELWLQPLPYRRPPVAGARCHARMHTGRLRPCLSAPTPTRVL